MKKILCFGDSNTWGHNPVDCSQLEKPWTVWLKDIVPEYEIVSDGVCGRATTHYLENEDKTNGLKDFRERYLSGENDFDLNNARYERCAEQYRFFKPKDRRCA